MESEISAQEMPYTNREIRERWHDTSNSLQEILGQTTRTNGAVADINKWRERINGGAIVAGFFLTLVIIPILTWAVYVLVNIDATVQSSIVKALSVYDINK